jgi:hypothetical protein
MSLKARKPLKNKSNKMISVPENNQYQTHFKLEFPSLIQIITGIAILIGMSVVTMLAFAANLGFLTEFGFLVFRTQTGLIIVCIFSWIAHFAESLYGVRLMQKIRVPIDLTIQWGVLIFLFGFLSLGPLKKRIQQFKQNNSILFDK